MRYIFHPPKTAGGTVSSLVVQEKKIPNWSNVRNRDIAISATNDIKFSSTHIKHLPIDKTKIDRNGHHALLIRNPYSRLWSWYCYSIKRSKQEKRKLLTFDDFFKKSLMQGNPGPAVWGLYSPCYRWYFFMDKENTELIRFESLRQDVLRVFDIDLEVEDRVYNMTSIWQVEESLDNIPKVYIPLINRYYEKDFETFGYKMYK